MNGTPVIAVDLDGVCYGFAEAVQVHVQAVFDVHLKWENLLPSFTLVDWVSASDAPEHRKKTIKDAVVKLQSGGDMHFMYQCVKPLPGAKLAINRLAEHFEIRAVTSRPIALRAVTLKMIARDFPVIENIHHAKNKGAFVKKDLRAAWMIEDNAGTVEDCLKHRVRTLYVRHPWGREVVHPPGLWRLIEVRSALEASEKILEFVSKREGESNLVESC